MRLERVSVRLRTAIKQLTVLARRVRGVRVPVQKNTNGLFEQGKATMLVTMFDFIGVEGASGCSRFSRERADLAGMRPAVDGQRAGRAPLRYQRHHLLSLVTT